MGAEKTRMEFPKVPI